MQSSLVKLLSVVSLLLVLLTVDCHAANGIDEPKPPFHASIRLLNPNTGYRQFTSLVFNESRPVLQELLPPPDNKLLNTRDYLVYKQGSGYMNFYSEPGTAPPLKLMGNTASESFQRGDWVSSATEREDVMVTHEVWVRCQPKIATPRVTDITRDIRRVLHESTTQLKHAFAETFITPATSYIRTHIVSPAFKYRNVHCIHLREYLSERSQLPTTVTISRKIKPIFNDLLLDIKLMHWYMPIRQVLRYSLFDERRESIEEMGMRRDAALPIFYEFPGSVDAARMHNWSIIKETAQRIVEAYDGWANGVSSAEKNAGAPSVHLIAQLCRLIAKASTDMTFNELVERIAELAKYSPDVIMKTTSLDSNLADLKMMANLDLLKDARFVNNKLYSDAASGIKVVSNNPNFPAEVSHMMVPYNLGDNGRAINDVFFRAARVDRFIPRTEIIRLEKLKKTLETKELLHSRGKCWREGSSGCDYTF